MTVNPFTTRTHAAGRRGPGKKISNGLAALSAAAILAVFAAGYDKTSDAADQFARQAAGSRRRPVSARETHQSMAAAIAENAATQGPPQNGLKTPAVAPPSLSPSLSKIASPSSAAVESHALQDGPAPAPEESHADAPAAEPAENDSEYADGTFLGRGTSRHGDVQVQLVIQAGRIVSSSVAKCMTQYSCEVLLPLNGQLVNSQSPDRIDNVTGATDSVNAYYGGAVSALATSANVKVFQKQFKTPK